MCLNEGLVKFTAHSIADNSEAFESNLLTATIYTKARQHDSAVYHILQYTSSKL